MKYSQWRGDLGFKVDIFLVGWGGWIHIVATINIKQVLKSRNVKYWKIGRITNNETNYVQLYGMIYYLLI